MTTWFTSDLHLGHENIIKYCNRPFRNAAEMDEALIANWNERVHNGDQVYVIGDFSFRDPKDTSTIVSRLNGNIHLVRGNHDKDKTVNQCRPLFTAVHEGLHELKVEGQRIILCHYAFRVWNKSHHGSWHLYGHSHGTLPDDPNSLSLDVGSDCHGYRPISFAEVKDLMAKKTWKPVDHHGEDRE